MFTKLFLISFILFNYLNCKVNFKRSYIPLLAFIRSVAKPSTTSSSPTTATVGTFTQPTVTNVLNNGIIESGFIIGTSATGTVKVEVSIDNGAYSSATGTTSWKFALPNGANTWRDFTRHTLNIRSTGPSNSISSPVTISLRKGKNKDINGDGYGDLLACNYAASSNLGKANIFYSTGANGIVTTVDSSADAVLSGTTAAGNFCGSAALDDINGDGYADVLVGSFAVASRKVFIFHSTGPNGVATQNDTTASNTITGTGVAQFARSIATGDMNGDGFADLAVLADLANAIYIFHSTGTAGITATAHTSAYTTITGTVGPNITVGDINGDGYADLAMASGNSATFHSSGSSGITITTIGSATMTLAGVNAYMVTLGDVNNDGFSDVILGDYAFSSSNGIVRIIHSQGSSGISSTIDSSLTGTTTGSFGFGLASCDVNGDGIMDVLVGARLSGATNRGRAYIFNGTSSGLSNLNDTAANTILTGTVNNMDFGYSVGCGNINGDGYMDIIVGASASSSAGSGRVFIYHSTSSSAILTGNDTTANVTIQGTLTGQLGFWVNQ